MVLSSPLSAWVNDILDKNLDDQLAFGFGESRVVSTCVCVCFCLSGDAWTHAGVAHVICDGMSVMYLLRSGSACINATNA